MKPAGPLSIDLNYDIQFVPFDWFGFFVFDSGFAARHLGEDQTVARFWQIQQVPVDSGMTGAQPHAAFSMTPA